MNNKPCEGTTCVDKFQPECTRCRHNPSVNIWRKERIRRGEMVTDVRGRKKLLLHFGL